MPFKSTAVRDVWVTMVKVTGYKKEGGRRGAWVYVIETCWSDQSRFEIYRRYADFFAFQDTLLTLFPREAGKYDRLDRCIPYLPTADNVLQFVGGGFSAKLLESRLRTINYYCETILLKLGPHVSRSHYVLQFFKCQPGDEQFLDSSRPLSMHPQSVPAGSEFEEYQVAVDFTANSEEHLTVKVGEIVSVLSKDSSDWWYVSKGAKQSGWVPKSYLQTVTGDTEDFLDDPEEWTDDEIAVKRRSYLAIADYETSEPNQLTFEEGAKVMVLDKEEDGWWLAVMDNKVGWVPSSFLEPLEGELEDSVSQTMDKEDSPAGEEDASSYETFWAVRKYTAALPDEVDLPLYAEVEVVSMNTSGWWLVRLSGKEGLAPATYLSPVDPQTAEAVEGNREGLIPSIDGEQRGIFIKRQFQQIRSPPPRSESVHKLSRRYRKGGGRGVQKVSTLSLVNERRSEGDNDIARNSSVSSDPLLHHSSPLLHASMEGIDDDRDVTASLSRSDVTASLSRSPVMHAKLESINDDTRAISSLSRSSPVLSKKPEFINFSPTSSPRSSPMLNRQLSEETTVRKSPTAWKKFGKTLSVDVADVTCKPRSRANPSWALKDGDNGETSSNDCS